MSPVTAIAWATSIVVLTGLGAGAVSEPRFFDMWVWVVPLAAVTWILVFAALSLPSLGLLKLREWSAFSYAILLGLLGAIVGGGIGAANGAVLGGAIFGAVVYLGTAIAMVFVTNMQTNSTAETDAHKGGARGSP